MAGKGLAELLTCLARWGVSVKGQASRPEDVRVNDLLKIEGDEQEVCRQLERCDPGWRDYLSRAKP